MGFVLGGSSAGANGEWSEVSKTKEEGAEGTGTVTLLLEGWAEQRSEVVPPLVGFAYSTSDTILEHDFIVSVQSSVRLCGWLGHK